MVFHAKRQPKLRHMNRCRWQIDQKHPGKTWLWTASGLLFMTVSWRGVLKVNVFQECDSRANSGIFILWNTKVFSHKKVTSYWPQVNGEVEGFLSTLKRPIKTTQVERKPWKQEVFTFLRNQTCNLAFFYKGINHLIQCFNQEWKLNYQKSIIVSRRKMMTCEYERWKSKKWNEKVSSPTKALQAIDEDREGNAF